MTAHRMHCTILCLIATTGCTLADSAASQPAGRLPGTGPGTPAEAFEKLKAAAEANDVDAAMLLLAEGAVSGYSKQPIEKQELAGMLPLIATFTYRDTVVGPPEFPDRYPAKLRDMDRDNVAFVQLSALDPGTGLPGTARMVFIRQQDAWKFYPIGWLGVDAWPISGKDASGATLALGSVIAQHDWRGAFDLIDPQMRKGVEPDKFQAEVLRRREELARMEAARGDRKGRDRDDDADDREGDTHEPDKSKLDPRPKPPTRGARPGYVPPVTEEYLQKRREWLEQLEAWEKRNKPAKAPTPRPFVAWSGLPQEGCKATRLKENGRQIVELSRGDDSERFVIIDGRWYWQPKKEYTLWPYLKYDAR